LCQLKDIRGLWILSLENILYLEIVKAHIMRRQRQKMSCIDGLQGRQVISVNLREKMFLKDEVEVNAAA
jgi:hypothetical protein